MEGEENSVEYFYEDETNSTFDTRICGNLSEDYKNVSITIIKPTRAVFFYCLSCLELPTS